MLKCRLCPGNAAPQSSLSALKYHVGLDHLQAAMMSCVVESGEYWRCSLCSYKLALTAAQPGGPKHRPDPAAVARHVAVVHNYIGHAYTSRASVVQGPRTSEPYQYSCELCPNFVTGRDIIIRVYRLLKTPSP
jgi:hypothetical protein